MNKIKLKIARRKIDQIDNRIFNLIRKRTKVVKYMLSLKQFKSQIIDQKRINAILKNIRKKSVRHRVDSKITSRIWKAMIWSYISYQRRNFKKR